MFMFLDFHRTMFTFLSLLDLLGVVLFSVLDFRSKDLLVGPGLLTQGCRCRGLGRHLEGSSGHTLGFCPGVVRCRFRNMFLGETLTRFSTLLQSTNSGGSNVLQVGSMTQDDMSCTRPFYGHLQIFPKTLHSD